MPKTDTGEVKSKSRFVLFGSSGTFHGSLISSLLDDDAHWTSEVAARGFCTFCFLVRSLTTKRYSHQKPRNTMIEAFPSMLTMRNRGTNVLSIKPSTLSRAPMPSPHLGTQPSSHASPQLAQKADYTERIIFLSLWLASSPRLQLSILYFVFFLLPALLPISCGMTRSVPHHRHGRDTFESELMVRVGNCQLLKIAPPHSLARRLDKLCFPWAPSTQTNAAIDKAHHIGISPVLWSGSNLLDLCSASSFLSSVFPSVFGRDD